MPRPKGSKNKKKIIVTAATSVEDINLQIVKLEAEIAELTIALKNKKAELKSLNKARIAAEKQADQMKQEAEKKKILEAVEKSGKSIDEILEMLK